MPLHQSMVLQLPFYRTHSKFSTNSIPVKSVINLGSCLANINAPNMIKIFTNGCVVNLMNSWITNSCHFTLPIIFIIKRANEIAAKRTKTSACLKTNFCPFFKHAILRTRGSI